MSFLWIIWFTYDYMGHLLYYSAFILWFDNFLDSGVEICQIFCWFFGKFLKKSKIPSEINWPIAPVTFHISFWTYVFQSGAPTWKHKHIFHNQFNSRNCIWHVMLKLDWDIFIKPLIKRSQHNRHKIIWSNTWIFFMYCTPGLSGF